MSDRWFYFWLWTIAVLCVLNMSLSIVNQVIELAK